MFFILYHITCIPLGDASIHIFLRFIATRNVGFYNLEKIVNTRCMSNKCNLIKVRNYMESKNFITFIAHEWGFMKNEMSSSAKYEYLYTKITSRIHLPYKF